MNRKHTLKLVSFASYLDFLLADFLFTLKNTQVIPRLQDHHLKQHVRRKPP